MEILSALLALCAGTSPVTGEFPSQRPVTQSFDISLICAWINGWTNSREAGDLRRHRIHYEVTIMDIPELSACEEIVQSFSVYFTPLAYLTLNMDICLHFVCCNCCINLYLHILIFMYYIGYTYLYIHGWPVRGRLRYNEVLGICNFINVDIFCCASSSYNCLTSGNLN